MKASGIVRRVDQLGRVVLPADLRESMDIAPQTPMEIYYDGEDIVLRKHRPSCYLCRETTGLHEFHGKLICDSCIAALARKSAGE